MKNIDKDTLLTAIYTIVDDIMKTSETIQNALQRSGPEPKLTDAEIISIALYQDIIGEPNEKRFFRIHEKELKKYFPDLNERSRFNRRKRDLWTIFLAVRIVILKILKVSNIETAVIDSAPIPCVSYKRDKKCSRFDSAGYGVCTSKAMKYFGYKFHNLISLSGVIIDFVLTSAAPYDNQVVLEFLEQQQVIIHQVLGDKAYNDQALQQKLEELLNITLWAPRKDNQQQIEPKHKTRFANRIRLMVETVLSQLQQQFTLSRHLAKSKWGLFTRVASKVTAHTIGILINKLFSRPPLALASLAC